VTKPYRPHGAPDTTLLIGMDTPQLTPGLLAVDWEVADAWFGPAADGGFWGDVDTAADALAVALQAPRSRFAARAREYLPVLRRSAAARPVGAAREQP
jgi:uncharacterized protein